MEEKQNYFVLISIVAIVAVVGVISMMVTTQKGRGLSIGSKNQGGGAIAYY